MIFKVGDKLPNVDLFENTPSEKVNLAQAAAQKKIIVFGVPGAFTPGCSKVNKTIYFLIIKLKYIFAYIFAKSNNLLIKLKTFLLHIV